MVSLGCKGLVVAATLAVVSLDGHAGTYALNQQGFTAGGSVSGFFQGEDLNNNGVIASFEGEVTSLSLSFSGNSLVPSFTYGMSELRGFVWEVGTSFIGDSSGQIPWGEGVIAGPLIVTDGFTYNSGLLPVVNRGGAFFAPDGSLAETTTSLLAVSSVPELGTAQMLALGLVAGLLLQRKRSGA